MIFPIPCNRHILEKFIDGALGLEGEEEEEVAREKKEGIRQQRNVDDDDDDAAAFDPEEAYLKINANLRTAFKKQHQLPLVSELSVREFEQWTAGAVARSRNLGQTFLAKPVHTSIKWT